jgi:hypothetical protein
MEPGQVLYLQRSTPIAALAFEFPGLHLVSYGGGDAMREASTLFHSHALFFGCGTAHATASAAVRVAVRAAVSDALAALAADPGGLSLLHPGVAPRGASDLILLGLDTRPIDDDAWAGAAWSASIVVSTPVRGSRTANLFHHGWIHGDAANRHCSAAQSFPLIGVWGTAGCVSAVHHSSAEVDPAPYDDAPCNERLLKPADCHIHTVDPFAGGTRDDFIALLMESGMEQDAAVAHSDTEAAMASMYHFGADNARVAVAPSPESPVGSAWVLCVDRSSPQIRVLVTLLLVVDSHADCAAIEAAVGSGSDTEPCASCLLRVLTAVPQLTEAVLASCVIWRRICYADVDLCSGLPLPHPTAGSAGTADAAVAAVVTELAAVLGSASSSIHPDSLLHARS